MRFVWAYAAAIGIAVCMGLATYIGFTVWEVLSR